ncbi:hypothetical protein [Rudanella lutea]|uniref:hypothetical protein n=1 Tax=Rudanella lutea TaxID=451374 RepID=UPI0004874631|nr:hypothetical protein [Rudanella lutea]
MKILLLSTALASLAGGFFVLDKTGLIGGLPDPAGVKLQGHLPTLTPLQPTPRAFFRPTTRKGYWNIDVVGDFQLPPTKTLIFSAAGRNLHVDQSWDKLFRRGFSAIDQTRMIGGTEVWREPGMPPANWRSRLKPSQRSLTIYRNYYIDEPFALAWSRDSELARQTWYRRPPSHPQARKTMYQASYELCGQCVNYGDCPPGTLKNTNGFIFFDLENDGTSAGNQQEHANMYVYMAKTVKENAMPYTQIGSITPVPHNSFGYSRTSDYTAGPEWLWTKTAQHTATSRQRGMPDDILGKSFSDYMDIAMPGTYYLYPDFDYTIPHNADDARHWLASLVGEQEVNMALTNKRRVAWQWLFNTQSSEFANSAKASNAAPPAIAEGMSIFYWFTGAYGVLFWDDHNRLTPSQPVPRDPAMQGLGDDRNYACYEHYLHGLWRLFKHHGDLFNGREKYLNQNTECSFDGGQTWYKYNANQLKTKSLPFVRAIVNGDQILVSATMPYAQANQSTRVLVRYVENGYRFYSQIQLRGDEIYLGRATMSR